MNDTNKENLLMENAIEIAMNIMPRMINEHPTMSRKEIISHIQRWAIEAEKEWQGSEYEKNGEYYDFIDEYSVRKYKELSV